MTTTIEVGDLVRVSGRRGTFRVVRIERAGLLKVDGSRQEADLVQVLDRDERHHWYELKEVSRA